MKTFKTNWLVGSMAAGMLALGSQVALAGIAGSQHDFTPTGNAQGVNGNGTADVEICAFCHTPHAADADFEGAPLWNKSYTAAGDYAASGAGRYSSLGTSTLDGDEAVVGSVSLACLSCHDGTQAMDVVINMPGQDLNSGNYDPNTSIGTMTSTGGLNSIAAIGSDDARLKNDHPISIEYGGGKGATALGTNNGDLFSDFVDPDFREIEASVKNGNVIWFIESRPEDTNNGRIDKDEIRLYNRSGGDMPYVECGSCHDPHNTASNYDTNIADASASLADGTTVDFLRKSNANSAICLTCHDK